jgi:hypothetical protein
MHTTITIEGRQVGVEVSPAVLHTRGDFCGNLHVLLGFDDPVSTETVLEHLRIKLFGNDDLLDALAHGEKAGGLEVVFSTLDDPSLGSFPPDEIPDLVELCWLEDNIPTRLGEVVVQTVAEEPESGSESSDEPGGGSGCAGVLLAVAGGLLLLAGLTGCPTTTPTAPAAGEATPLPGCEVQRLEDAEQAVRQLHGKCRAYVYQIDGDLSTCRFEVFYKPDEESEETLAWSATGDSVVESVKNYGEILDVSVEQQDFRHVLAIVLPEYPSTTDDRILFSFSAQETPRAVGTIPCQLFRDAKTADELFGHSVLGPSSSRYGSERGPAQRQHIKPGEESEIVWWEVSKDHASEAEDEDPGRRDFVRYRVTVTCLE